ncbi:MAG: hypothetical protein AAF805_01065 [Planctomycetota bacterium]
MADESADDALSALRDHLYRFPDDVRRANGLGPLELPDDATTSVVERWHGELLGKVEACRTIAQAPGRGRGLDAAWLRALAIYLTSFEELRRDRGFRFTVFDAFSTYHHDLAEFGDVANRIAAFRSSGSASGVAALLDADDPEPQQRLRKLASDYETQWIEAALPPRNTLSPQLVKQTPTSAAQNKLRDGVRPFLAEAGEIVLRWIDEGGIPDKLRKSPTLANAVFHAFRGTEPWPDALVERLVRYWLPQVRPGYGSSNPDARPVEFWQYPGSDADDAKRFNLGVRAARCVAALADALADDHSAASRDASKQDASSIADDAAGSQSVSSHNEELQRMASEEARRRERQEEAKRRGDDRYESYYKPYDGAWNRVVHAPCNPVAGEPLEPEWLLEALTTLAELARKLDEFDGGTAEADRLRWLRTSPPAAENRIAKAFAVAMAAAVEGTFDLAAAGAVSGMLETHPGNELLALQRAYPEGDSRPRFEPIKMPTATPSARQADDDFVARLLAGPDDAELSPRDLARLEAHLSQPVSMSVIQREQQATGESATQSRRNKLQFIRDFNRNLTKDQAAIGKEKRVALPPPAVKATPIRQSLARLKDRFEDGLRRYPPLIGVMVHHTTPTQGPQPDWPDGLIEGLQRVGIYPGPGATPSNSAAVRTTPGRPNGRFWIRGDNQS